MCTIQSKCVYYLGVNCPQKADKCRTTASFTGLSCGLAKHKKCNKKDTRIPASDTTQRGLMPETGIGLHLLPISSNDLSVTGMLPEYGAKCYINKE